MSYIAQNPQLLVFLVVLAVLFVLALILAGVSISRRRKRGLTLSNSTEYSDIGNARQGDPNWDSRVESTGRKVGEERSPGGVSKYSGGDGRS